MTKKDNSPFGELFFFYPFLYSDLCLRHRVSAAMSRLLTATKPSARSAGCSEGFVGAVVGLCKRQRGRNR